MEKSKIAAIGFLVLLGGAMVFARMREAPLITDEPTPVPVATPAAQGKGETNIPDEKPTAAAPGTAKNPTENVTKLKIVDVKKGDGPEAQDGDTLTMNYRGTLLNGKEFDSSLKPGRTPFEFTLGAGQVIKGWDEGIKGMKAGGKRHLVIPAYLAYGDNSPSPDIPSGSPLVFDVELLGVKKG